MEATAAEQAWMDREAMLEADPDWRAFVLLCFPEEGPPGAEAVRKGVAHLQEAARRGHSRAQHQLATAFHLGRCGCPGIVPDLRQAAEWYRLAAENGYPTANMNLTMLRAAHPELQQEGQEGTTNAA